MLTPEELPGDVSERVRAWCRGAVVAEVLSLLALLVQKHKY